MNLFTNCKSCKRKVMIKSDAATRADLQMNKGDEFSVNCQNCGKLDKVHVNDIKAETNKIVILIGLFIGIVFTFFLWKYLGGISTVSGIIPILFWQQQMNSTRFFNSYKIKRK